MKKAVIFDLDGTLIDTEYQYYEAYQEAFKHQKKSLSREEYGEYYAGTGEEAIKTHIYKKVGNRSMARQIYADSIEKQKDIEQSEGIKVKEGVGQTLDILKEKGVSLIVASPRKRKTVVDRLKKANLFPYFSLILAGEELEAIQSADSSHSAELNNYSKDDILIVDDSRSGTAVAYNSGIDVILVPDLLPATDQQKQQCLAVVSSITEIIPYVLEEEVES